MKKLKILVINLDNIEFTRDCLFDLTLQNSSDFEIVLVDQNSSEVGTSEFLDSVVGENIEVIRNETNKPLNQVWNWFQETYPNEYLCFLNNDVSLPTNFVKSTIETFEAEPYVGIVVHPTNHLGYTSESETLNYVVVEPFVNMQGWDFTFRRPLYGKVPEYLKTYCGDDFIFNDIYTKGFNLAYVLNSPIIHYEGQSKKSMKTSGMEDIISFKENKNNHYLKVNFDYSNFKTTFNKIDKNE